METGTFVEAGLDSQTLPGGSLGIAGISSFRVGVPEPSTFALAGLGTGSVGCIEEIGVG